MRILVTLLALAIATPAAQSQTDTTFTQQAICGANGSIDLDKMRKVALKEIEITSLFKKDMSFNAQGLEDEIGVSSIATFIKRYVNAKNDYFDIHRDPPSEKKIAFLDLFQNPQAYVMKCKRYPRQLPAVASARKAADDFAKGVGNKLILGKDLDELGKSLKARAPAKVSVTRDEGRATRPFRRSSR